MNVIVVTIKYPYCDHECVNVYDSMEAAMHRLEMSRLHGVDEGEEINIQCVEVLNQEMAHERLNNVRKYKGESN